MPKVWFITGSSRGLGNALAEYALKNGDSVIATARNPDSMKYLVDTYGADKVLPAALDVTSWEAATAAVEAGVEKFKRIDLVVNNAGYANTAAVEDLLMDDFHQQVEANLFGVVNVSKAVLPVLRRQGAGHVFQISSLGGRLGSPGLSAYQSSKWAVGGFSTCLAAEVGPLGVRVTVLEPGGMRTDWAGSSMKVPPVSEPYQQSVGQFSNMLRSSLGKEVTNPEKVGPIIDKLYQSSEPPVRMLVGSDAVQLAGQVAKAQRGSDEKWKELSLSAPA
jgi:NAD(P)-dependent dehydrogenase (short-subunit alcohol dehydrogenase family)